MSLKSTVELYVMAGFEPGEVAVSGPLRAAFCTGTATADQLAEYSKYADKWNEYTRLTIEQDRAVRREAAAPDPTRHSGDQSGGLGAALADLRAGQAGRAPVVVRPRMISVDVSGGNGGMMDVPEPEEWPLFVGSAGSTGHQRIAAAFAGKKR